MVVAECSIAVSARLGKSAALKPPINVAPPCPACLKTRSVASSRMDAIRRSTVALVQVSRFAVQMYQIAAIGTAKPTPARTSVPPVDRLMTDVACAELRGMRYK